MGKIIRSQRKGKPGSVYRTPKSKRIAPPRYRNLDFAERQGYIKGVVRSVLHDPGRGAPLLKVDFKGFPHLGIWTKKDAPFICIEPWFGYSDTTESNGDFTSKEGIQHLEQNTVFELQFSITIL